MSQSYIKTHFNDESIKNIRRVLQEKKGQILLLHNVAAFREALREVLANKKLYISKQVADNMLSAGRTEALRLNNDFKAKFPDTYNAVLAKGLSVNLFKASDIGHTAFIVNSFSHSISEVKKKMLSVLSDSRSSITDDIKAEISKRVHKGHGVSGDAVAIVDIAFGLEKIEELTGLKAPDLLAHLQNAITSGAFNVTVKEAAALKRIITKYHQVVQNGELRADYASVITYQYGKENTGPDAALEKKLKNTFYNDFVPYLSNRILSMQGSSTLKEKIAHDIFIRQIVEELKKNSNFKVEDRVAAAIKKAKSRTSGVAATNIKEGTDSITRINTKVPAKKGNVKVSKTTATDANIKLKSLIPTINRSLHDTIQDNMGSPRLNYRTGRFARSARVLDITETQKGYPSITYTYMHDPYKVFEFPNGSPRLATPDRDPRLVIELSIREIAKKLIADRFYMKRV